MDKVIELSVIELSVSVASWHAVTLISLLLPFVAQ
jgi:hypothetical protein